jgi:antitoxin FitA
MTTPTITIRNLPEDVLETIRERARHNGESLQAYIWKRLVADACRPTPAEVVDRARERLASGSYPAGPVDVDAFIHDGQM